MITRAASPASVEADPRIELIAAVESLAKGNPCPQKEPSAYLDRILRAFDAGHPACARFADMTPADWRHRHPSLIMLDFTAPPELKASASLDHYGQEGRADAVARFMPALRSFSREAGFMDFFAGERKFYDKLLSPMRESLGAADYLGPLADYLGEAPAHRYHFVMSPLYHGPVMHNLLYRRQDGIFDIYSISGHRKVLLGEPNLGYDAEEFVHTAWHEVAHTVIDGLTQAHRAELEPLSPLYALMTGMASAKYRGPQGWLHMVDEHVIRALTSRLHALTSSEEAGLRRLEQEKRHGFALVGAVYRALIEYESQRSRYPRLADFYPRLVETLSRLYSRAS